MAPGALRVRRPATPNAVVATSVVTHVSSQFLFNGDLVDRGPHGVEVACLVFAFMLLYPESVFVNR